MLGTKNVNTVGLSKQVKNHAKSQIFERLRKPEVCRYYSGNIRYNSNKNSKIICFLQTQCKFSVRTAFKLKLTFLIFETKEDTLDEK